MIFFKPKITYHSLLFSLLLLSLKKAYPQQQAPLLINYSRVIYNPAMAGINAPTELFLTTRSDQYRKLKLIRGNYYFNNLNSCAAVQVESSQSLLETQTVFTPCFAYRIKLKKTICQFGIAPQIYNYRLNTDNLMVFNTQDPSLPIRNQIWSHCYSGGMVLKNERILFSIKASNVFLNNKREKYSDWYQKRNQLSLYSSYQIPLGSHFKYTPSVYCIYSPYTTFAAVSNQFSYKNIGASFQYGSFSNWSISLSILYDKIKPLTIYGGYSLSSGSLGISKFFSHEIFFSIGLPGILKKHNGLRQLPSQKSPVYF